jgi:rod shape-determining protein MreC
MKSTKNKKEILSFFTIFLLILLTIVFQGHLRSFFYDFSRPLENYFFEAGEKSSNFFKGLLFFCEIKRENQFLKEENQELLSRIIELEDLRRENQELKSALGLKLEEKFKLLQVRAILHNNEEDFILISNGQKDGLKKNMTVINFHNVLIGRVFEVYEKTAKVSLISDKNIKFSVEIDGKKINGLLKGMGRDKIFLDLVPKEEELNVGALISTAGLEGGFPQGLLVGKIKEVEKTDLSPFQQVDIEPLFNIEDNNNLLVILSNDLD